MRLGLIFSNDWELFGDGSGDYWEIQHRRLRQLLDVAARYGVPLTVMAEIAQQWAHRRLGQTEPWAREIADDWDATLVSAVRAGCDVQLHLHPQWLGAQWSGGTWRLNFERWAVSSLTAAQIAEVLRQGKQHLETLLRTARPGYRTVLFRAGALCIEPARHAIVALREAGFLADTSVTKGLHDPRFYDYRAVPSHVLPWEVDPLSMTRAGESSGMIELPILSTRIWDSPLLRKSGRWHYTRWLANDDRAYLRDRAAYLARAYAGGPRAISRARRSLGHVVGRLRCALLRRHFITLDYDVLPAPVFVDCVERLLADPELQGIAASDVIVPVMALGHTKVIPHAENFRRVLAQLVARLGDRIVFWTGQSAAEYWTARLRASAAGDGRARVSAAQRRPAA